MAISDLPARLATMDSATIHESGAPMVMDGAIRHLAGPPRLCGPALTVLCPPGDNLAIHHAVASARPGDVLVVHCCDPDYGVWGEVLSLAALQRGIAGLVLDGAIRDLSAMDAVGLPAFARGTRLRGAAKKVPGEINIAVACGGALVRPGDIVFGDESGIVVVPPAEVDAVVERAEERVRKEAVMMDGLRAGRTTIELLNLRKPTGA